MVTVVIFVYIFIGVLLAAFVYWLDVRKALSRGFNQTEIKEWLYYDSDYKPKMYEKLNSHFLMPPIGIIFFWFPGIIAWVLIGLWKGFNWLIFKSAKETIDNEDI